MKNKKPASYQMLSILLFFLITVLSGFALSLTELGGLAWILPFVFALPVAVIIHGIGEIVKQLKILNNKNNSNNE